MTAPDQDWFLRLCTLRQRYFARNFLQNEFLKGYIYRIRQNTIGRILDAKDLHPKRAPTGYY